MMMVMYMLEKHLSLIIGPAKYPEDDARMVAMFLAEPGTKIICGVSTANMVSRFRQQSENSNLEAIEGLTLVTDGTLVLAQALDILLHQSPVEALSSHEKDAKILVKKLLEADSISFLIGMAINKSQRSLSLPAKPIVKSRFARELIDLLKEKGKKVMVEYF